MKPVFLKIELYLCSMETFKTILQPSAFLFAISQSLEKEDMSKLYRALINDDYQQVIEVINELQEQYTPDNHSNPEQLLLPIFLYQFRNTIIRDVHFIDELKHHKESMDFTYILNSVTSILDKYNITNSKTIAKEVYEELFVNNMKKVRENDKEAERNLRTLAMLKKRSKNS
jgi:hypothetical protein